jgi:para-nitrobenzyl esterase
MLRRAFALLVLLPIAAGASTAITESGALKGARVDGLNIYRGIPYAAPPTGELRWRAPEPVKPWTGVRDVTGFAPACMQKGVSMPGETPPTVSEDCLYLNIWAPAGKRLPVIVWIHGGGYSNGSASMPLYHGDRLAHKGVIVVTIAYRLGPFGYLVHPELTRESAHGASGNYGLLDQLAALQWIQRNIAAFGGDPKQVTIAGQSAGSMAVSILMASPLAKGLFQRAIGESGGLFEPLQIAPIYMLAGAEHQGEQYFSSLGAGSLADMRKLPAGKLLEGTAGEITHPILDGYVLPASPYETFAAGRHNDVPILVGSNADEARSLTHVESVAAATFCADLEHSFGPLPAAIIAAYPHATDVEARRARLDLERDLRFGWDMWAWARLQARTGHSAVYYYSFTQQPPGWGASHFAEMWYVFDHLGQAPWKPSQSDQHLAQVMSDYWVDFAKSGNPNGKHVPLWHPLVGDEGPVQYLGESITSGTLSDLKQLKVFDEVYASLRH